MHLICGSCRVRYTIAEFDPSRKYGCRKCGAPLARPDEAPTLTSTEDPEEVRRAAANPKNRHGKYVSVRELGRGGMGIVTQAWDTALKRWVALKVLTAPGRKEDLARFRREAQMAAALRHPNIVGIYEVGEQEAGQPFIAMEYIEGRTLAGQKLPVRRAVEILAEIAQAVEFAHSKEIIHRDLKPHNVMIDKDGKAWVMDFGLAKHVAGESQITMSGTVLGTPSYMSPEQAQGDLRALGRATDVYSLGAILYEMLTGRPPFHGKTPLETLELVVKADVRPPSELNAAVPRDLETIALKCLEKDPRRRYPSARLLAEDLKRWMRGEGIAARRASILTQVGKRVSRNRAGFAAAVVVVLAVAAVVGVLVVARRRAAPGPPPAARRETESPRPRDPPPSTRGEAQPHFDAGRRKFDEVVKDQYRRGEDLSRIEHRLREAVESFTRAIALHPEFYEAFHHRGLARMMLQEIDAAEADFTRAIELQATYSDAYYERGRLYLERSTVSRGRALRLPSHDRQAEAWRGKARADFVEFRRLGGGGSHQSDYAAALLAFSENRLPDALALCEKLGAANTGNELVYKLQGDILKHLSENGAPRFPEAERAYDRAIELRPNYFEAIFMRGNVRIHLGRGREAIEDFNEAIRIQPRFSDALTNRGVVRQQLGEVDAALRDFLEAVRINPRDTSAWNNLGYLRMMEQDYDRALEYFNRSVEADSTNIRALSNRAACKRWRNDFEGALRDYEEALRIEPRFADVYFNRAIIHMLRQHYDRAVRDFTDFLRHYAGGPEVRERAYFSRASSYYYLGRYREAIADWEQCLQLDTPRREEVERWIAESRRKLGE